ncbi:CpsD/CapB family tyrosine-protein kinase [Cetobacterium sp. 8H]|uniref:CpsD/CapB family tyrosine-protein kinase n=1 Tax=Cetobacterium sp. 8H TaxID=2759681 RepID=UPI00163BB297|nr:CpsD/CapB family tyrosine-protein kinase [Cetobacterium sp. 8H]MBC2850881.1 CpsD/CapB family tyrosine-protein kinase [Cetobacterium sp. 8H]
MSQNLFFNDDNIQLSESLRVIRTNLFFLNNKEAGRVILITSSVPKEGKSLLAINYAYSIAITGKKVLLIDCDLRCPRLNEAFNLNFNHGLESLLANNLEHEKIVIKNISKNLDFIPSKTVTSNPTELFLNDKFLTLLNTVKNNYNTIIIDTPPLTIASDAAILSKLSDGVVYVVAYDEVSAEDLKFGKELLKNAKANIYGFVVNKAEKNIGNYGRKYPYDYESSKDSKKSIFSLNFIKTFFGGRE